VPIAIGGVHVTHDVQNIMNDIPQADFAFLNEAEKAFVHFIDCVNHKTTIDQVGQVIIRLPSTNNGVRFGKKFIPEGGDLNVIPPYEIMDIATHSRVGRWGRGTVSAMRIPGLPQCYPTAVVGPLARSAMCARSMEKVCANAQSNPSLMNWLA